MVDGGPPPSYRTQRASPSLLSTSAMVLLSYPGIGSFTEADVLSKFKPLYAVARSESIDCQSYQILSMKQWWSQKSGLDRVSACSQKGMGLGMIYLLIGAAPLIHVSTDHSMWN